MKKPGFFKRMFSFGRKEEGQNEPVEEAELEVAEPPLADPVINKEEPQPAPLKSDSKPGIAKADEQPEKIKHSKPIDSDPKPTGKSAVIDDDGEPNEIRPAPVKSENKSNISDDRPNEPEIVTRESLAPENSKTDDFQFNPETPEQEQSAEDQEKETGSKSDGHIVAKQEQSPVAAGDDKPVEKTSWLKRLSRGLSRTSSQLSENIAAVFTRKKLDDAALEDLEDILLQADLGVDTALNIVDSLAKQRMGKDVSDEEVRGIMAEEIEKTLAPVAMPLELDLDHKPHVILVVGVNGSGKTTTIGKLTHKLYDAGYSTMLVAGDTFRAAAIEQLKIWGDRTGSPVVSRSLGSDSSGLAFDAWQSARDQNFDVMMMDTAGRLQNKTELMAELEKIIRVLKKHDPTAPHTVLLTLDATTGQNALNQVEIFKKVAGVNGLIMTKLDGSARGGILVAISAAHKIPVYFIGVGEQVEDLEPFEAREFARSIAGLES